MCNDHSEETSNNYSKQKNTGETSSDKTPSATNGKINLVGGHIN